MIIDTGLHEDDEETRTAHHRGRPAVHMNSITFHDELEEDFTRTYTPRRTSCGLQPVTHMDVVVHFTPAGFTSHFARLVLKSGGESSLGANAI